MEQGVNVEPEPKEPEEPEEPVEPEAPEEPAARKDAKSVTGVCTTCGGATLRLATPQLDKLERTSRLGEALAAAWNACCMTVELVSAALMRLVTAAVLASGLLIPAAAPMASGQYSALKKRVTPLPAAFWSTRRLDTTTLPPSLETDPGWQPLEPSQLKSVAAAVRPPWMPVLIMASWRPALVLSALFSAMSRPAPTALWTALVAMSLKA